MTKRLTWRLPEQSEEEAGKRDSDRVLSMYAIFDCSPLAAASDRHGPGLMSYWAFRQSLYRWATPGPNGQAVINFTTFCTNPSRKDGEPTMFSEGDESALIQQVEKGGVCFYLFRDDHNKHIIVVTPKGGEVHDFAVFYAASMIPDHAQGRIL